MPRWRACPISPSGRMRPGSRKSGSPPSRTRCAACTGRPTPDDILPEGSAWSRLAYDELLAGQLALALVRAHLRRPAGRTTAGSGQLRKKLIAALPYKLTRIADPRGRRHRRRSRQARAHAAAAAGRRGVGQDRRRAARGHHRDRKRPAGGADGADRTPGAAAFQHHRALGRRHRRHRRDPHRPRARPRAQRASGAARRWRDPDADRHARAVPGRRPIPRPRARDRRRAAPLRRPPAAYARAQGRGRRRAGDDRDADPAHAGADLFRRHGHVGAAREARRPPADRHPHRPARSPERGRRRGRPRARRGPARLLGLPAGRGIREQRPRRRRGALRRASRSGSATRPISCTAA